MLLSMLVLSPFSYGLNREQVDEENTAQHIELEKYYPKKDVDAMIAGLLKEGESRRMMIKPYKFRFDGELMSAPKAGDYSVIYQGLEVWGVKPLPDASHSAYIKTPGGKVIGVYLQNSAALRLNNEAIGTKATFYVLHAYNYKHGPRLLVLSYFADNGQLKL